MSDLADLTEACHDRRVPQYAFSIHTERPGDAVGAVEMIHTSEDAARAYAASRSSDLTIKSARVTRYTVGQLGTRTPIALYVDGEERPRPDLGQGRRLYPSG